MTHDGMSPSERDEYEIYIIECLQDAGIEDPQPATVLQSLDDGAVRRAVDQIKEDSQVSFKYQATMTVSQLAEVLWKATQSR
ncbi:hypothetical protein HCG45_12465 [Pseudomonas fulva]|uniref:hypothetical protein n=1 Tax=Pseudomonas TaxID=286 RepID=UPI000EDDDF75|nr:MULTISPECIES: hypothetical protein [Pseudomonas]NIX93563.1 hypothetical protein [Pseudomonas fulva]HAL68597.1 hypothetical protein [Pseudomonas sp.]